MQDFVITVNDAAFSVEDFTRLFELWSNSRLNCDRAAEVLQRSIIVTARERGDVIGYVRIITDGYIFGVIAEVSATPKYISDYSLIKALLRAAADVCPTPLVIESYRLNGDLMKEIGWEQGVMSYYYDGKGRLAE